MTKQEIIDYMYENHVQGDFKIEEMAEDLAQSEIIGCKYCRDCKHWEICPCGKTGHERGTSIGYSIGECKDYEVN